MSLWPFGDLAPFTYRAIMADPPWHYEMYSTKGETKSPQAQYATMRDEDILALPVGDLADKDCLLFLWAVWPKIGLAVECIRRWGFKPVTGGSWVKMAKNGNIRIGTGYTLRSACEPFLIARMGPPQARLTDVPNVIMAEAREHSRKPDQARDIVERMAPGGPWLELFARTTRPGWAAFGNETEKFGGAA